MRISDWSSDVCSSDLLKPQTYMNESGRAVGEALRFHTLTPEQVIVLYDEIDLAPVKVRVKQGGGTGGHHGIRSLEDHTGTEFWRVRLGVGPLGHTDLVHGRVLSDFAQAAKASDRQSVGPGKGV